MGKANRCQTESHEVFHDSADSFQHNTTICIIYFYLFMRFQLSLNTIIFSGDLFCRNFKGIRSSQQVINNFVFFIFLHFSMFFYFFYPF